MFVRPCFCDFSGKTQLGSEDGLWLWVLNPWPSFYTSRFWVYCNKRGLFSKVLPACCEQRTPCLFQEADTSVDSSWHQPQSWHSIFPAIDEHAIAISNTWTHAAWNYLPNVLRKADVSLGIYGSFVRSSKRWKCCSVHITNYKMMPEQFADFCVFLHPQFCGHPSGAKY